MQFCQGIKKKYIHFLYFGYYKTKKRIRIIKLLTDNERNINLTNNLQPKYSQFKRITKRIRIAAGI